MNSRSPVFTVSRSPVLSVQELAAYLKVGSSTIYRLLKRGELPGYRVGSEWRFNVEALAEWLRAKEEIYVLQFLNGELDRRTR